MTSGTASQPCKHEDLEQLGTNRSASFARCVACGNVFISQGGRVWSVRALQPQKAESLSKTG